MGMRTPHGFPYEGKARGRTSGGPFFSVLPEKKGGEKGRLVTFGASCL